MKLNMAPRPQKETTKEKEEKTDKPKRKRGRPKKSEAEKAVKKTEETPSASLEAGEKKESVIAAVKKKKQEKYIYAVGRRKRAVATVRIYKKGQGKITINDKELKDFFPYFEYQEIVLGPLKLTGQEKSGDVTIRVKGGGAKGQAGAVSLGMARALIELNKDHRQVLKKAGFLRRDPRKKERKKPGLKRARRAPQWKKR